MNFGFKDAVKLASKGFKPTDIAELAALDENKFDKDDILSLVGNGYKLQDIKNLVKTFESNSDPDESGDGEEPASESAQDAPDNKLKEETSFNPSDEQEDDIDYKALYEKEKNLREKLEHSNQMINKEIKREKSDFDIALEIANNY